MHRLLFCVPLMMAALAASPDDDIRAAEKAWASAVVQRDFAALDQVFTPDLIYAHSTGNIETKAKYLDRLRSGKQRYDTLVHENLRVVVYGDAAVAHSIARVTGTNDNGPFNDHLMMIHLWVRQAGQWRLAAHQTTKIP